PPRMAAELKAGFQGNALRNLHLVAELIALLAEFEKQGIPAVPFKGPAVALSACGDLSFREAGDLDILVPRNDIVRAKAVLAGRGHRPIFPTATAREAAYLASLSGAREADYLLSHSEHHLVRD